jgi:hypothetical protein
VLKLGLLVADFAETVLREPKLAVPQIALKDSEARSLDIRTGENDVRSPILLKRHKAALLGVGEQAALVSLPSLVLISLESSRH